MSSENQESGVVEPEKRLVDPDNYNLRRRLRQLHDSREYVKEVKNDNLGKELANPRSDSTARNRAVAEAVTDYASELIPILQRRDELDAFLKEEIAEETTVDEFIERRGVLDSEPVQYTISMKLWSMCNRYFERVAGPEFENESLPKERNFDSTAESDS